MENTFIAFTLFISVPLQQGQLHAGPYQHGCSQQGKGANPPPLFLAVVKPLLSSQITTAKERWIYTGADPATGKSPGWWVSSTGHKVRLRVLGVASAEIGRPREDLTPETIPERL